MLETTLDQIIENPVLASILIGLSTIIIILVAIKPLVAYVVTKTKIKKDDEIAGALYGAIEEHKKEVEAIHKAAKKAKEKKCTK